MDNSLWITLAAVIISALTFSWGVLSTRYGLKQKANVDYVRSLEVRLQLAEEALERCRKSEEQLLETVRGLERKNLELLSIIVKHDMVNGTKRGNQ